MSNSTSEKQIDQYIARFAVTTTGKVLLKRKIRHLLERELSLGKSLYDIEKEIINDHIHDLIHEKPWVSINEHI